MTEDVIRALNCDLSCDECQKDIKTCLKEMRMLINLALKLIISKQKGEGGMFL